MLESLPALRMESRQSSEGILVVVGKSLPALRMESRQSTTTDPWSVETQFASLKDGIKAKPPSLP